MGIIRPATPGFLVTLAATIILAIVSFSVPLFKSIYFLKASLAVEDISGDITFGVLGYCLQLSNGTTCSKPTVGYELDINQLVGDNLSIQIPDIMVKWLTYALVLHIVALILAAISALFGLLAHVREMSMTCFSSCIAGFGATVALLAFIFDLAFFFIAKSRIDAVNGGSASLGNGIWLTLAAWILLFFSGCFFGLGRCCIKRRARAPYDKKDDGWNAPGAGGPSNDERLRLDAVKAEADRKARQNRGEGGLPAFQEYDPTTPLQAAVDGDRVYLEDETPYRDNDPEAGGPGAAAGYRPNGARRQGNGYTGGYAQAPAGSRAVDEYYSPARDVPNSSYPPRQQRRASNHTQSTSNYAASTYTYNAPAAPPVPIPTPAPMPQNQYLAAGNQYGHEQYPSGQVYGHNAGGTTYHSAASHQQQPSAYTQYPDPYSAHSMPPAQEPSFNPDTYNSTGLIMPAGPSSSVPYTNAAPYYPQHSQIQQPERTYTVGGGGYGANVVPAFNDQNRGHDDAYLPYPGASSSHMTPSPGPIDTNGGSGSHLHTPVSPVRGPRSQRQSLVPSPTQYEDSPPVYEDVTPEVPGGWGQEKR